MVKSADGVSILHLNSRKFRDVLFDQAYLPMVKLFLVKAQSERQEKRGCAGRISVLPVSDYQLDRERFISALPVFNLKWVLPLAEISFLLAF